MYQKLIEIQNYTIDINFCADYDCHNMSAFPNDVGQAMYGW
jgi:hypothetical protein